MIELHFNSSFIFFHILITNTKLISTIEKKKNKKKKKMAEEKVP
jgi:hypothetical protein